MTRPLLVIDGDSFAHRSYHALPKTIRRRGNKGGGAIVGFANFLLRLYEAEQPRAVLVGWDTLDEPTYRHRALEEYQSGREFDTELVDQLDVLPEFVAACGFANAKAAGYEADDFLAAAVAKEERRGPVIVATGDRDAYQLASAKTTILQPIKAGEMARTALKPADCRPPIIHVAATLLFFNVTIAQAQTIDCSFATAVDEVAICRSADLRTMDGELDRAYRAARVRWTSSMGDSVRIMQEEWIKERRKCGADEECLMNRMIERITALDKMRPDSPRWILETGKSPK